MDAERIAGLRERIRVIGDEVALKKIHGLPTEVLEATIDMLARELRGHLTASIPLDRLEQIAEAEGDGRLEILPCKVGDDIFIHDYNIKTEQYEVRAGKIRFVRYDAPYGSVVVSNGEYLKEWLKGAFPTPEAAAAALEGGKKR